jgi:hypothetical protein
MNEIIINADILPEPLFGLADSKKLSVKKDAGIITLSPAGEEIDYIDLLYGSCADGRLTVEKFQQWLREDEKDIDG